MSLPEGSGKSSPGTENVDEDGDEGCDDIDDDDGIEVRSGSSLYLKHDGGPLGQNTIRKYYRYLSIKMKFSVLERPQERLRRS